MWLNEKRIERAMVVIRKKDKNGWTQWKEDWKVVKLMYTLMNIILLNEKRIES